MATKNPRLLFYFLHLLGVGHVYRAKRLIEGFAAQNIDVDIIYGGHDVGETFDAHSIFHLPPIAAKDATYKDYIDDSGAPLSKDFMAKRQAKLLAHLDTLEPDAVLIEAWPFGRRVVRHEITAMLDALDARPSNPLVVSSVRDILQPRKPQRAQETQQIVQSRINHVLVHSDPGLIKLDATFPLASKIEQKLAYTGFVVPPVDLHADAESFDVVVTCGGGGFGFDMLQTALECARSGPLQDAQWCLATGPHMNQSDVTTLQGQASANVTIVPHLQNLAAHMAKAKLSISQCGYNTGMDTLAAGQATGCRAVFIPYDTQGQVEQLQRAQLLEQAGLATCLPQSQLSPNALNHAVETALNSTLPTTSIDFDGVANSARLMRQWMEQ